MNENKDILNVELYTLGDYDLEYAPVKATKWRKWWEEDSKTVNHAKFCLPLNMANQIGFYILSPATFRVQWDGIPENEPIVTITDATPQTAISTHSAQGSFTVQGMIIPRTPEGVFTWIKGIPNVVRPYTLMEAMIETWWNVANFGLVTLLHGPCDFEVQKGEPFAQMIFYSDKTLNADLVFSGDSSQLENRDEWAEKRSKYTVKELDYMKGEYPDGSKIECPHYQRILGKSDNKRKIDI